MLGTPPLSAFKCQASNHGKRGKAGQHSNMVSSTYHIFNFFIVKVFELPQFLHYRLSNDLVQVQV